MISRIPLPVTILAAGLMLAACNPGDEAGSNGASRASAPVSAEAASDALAAFGLAEQGRARWESRDQDGSTFTFTGFEIADPEGGLSAAQLILAGPEITGEGPVFDRFELTDGRVVETESDLQATFERILIVDAGPEIAEAVAAALQGREAFFDAADPAAGRFGEMRVEAVEITGTSETGQPLELTLASARALGHDGETIDEVAIQGLGFSTTDEAGAPVSVSLGALTVEGLASAFAGLAELQAGQAPSAPLVGSLSPDSQYDRFSVSDLAMQISGFRISMPSMEGAIEEERAGRIVSRTAMERLTMSADPAGASAQVAGVLDQLGYEALVFSFENAVRYDTEADRVETIEENYLRLEDGFTLRLEQSVQGLREYGERYAAWLAEAGAVEGEATLPVEVLEPLMIERVALILEDESLLDRGLTMAASMQGTTPEQLRVQAGAYVALLGAFAGGAVPPQLLSELQVALTAFVGQGGVLTVEMAPSEPVSVGVLVEQRAAADLSALGLSVSHEAP